MFFLGQADETLGDGVGDRTLRAEAVGVRIGDGFRDRFECEPMQGLHGAIAQGRDAQGPEFAVALGNVDAP